MRIEKQYYEYCEGPIMWCLVGHTKFGPYSKVTDVLLKGFYQGMP